MSELSEDFFSTTRQEVDKIIGTTFTNIQADATQGSLGGWNLVISAECRACKMKIEAHQSSKAEDWAYKLMVEIEDKALHHQSRWHKLILTPRQS